MEKDIMLEWRYKRYAIHTILKVIVKASVQGDENRVIDRSAPLYDTEK
jgi:hypothetical protein